MVMQKLNEDGSKESMFNLINRLMRKEEQKYTSIKVLNVSVTVSDEQEVERFWGHIFAQIGK